MPEDLKGRPWLQTASGEAWCADDPWHYDYSVEEIAHALSNLCRFSGHTKAFYSVAQHSVIVCQILESMWVPDPGPGLLQAALLHDAAEAYCLDVPSPIKRMAMMAGYREWLDEVERAIFGAFDLGKYLNRPAIKHADLVALATERRDVLGPSPHHTMWLESVLGGLPPAREKAIKPLSPKQAKGLFIQTWNRISSR